MKLLLILFLLNVSPEKGRVEECFSSVDEDTEELTVNEEEDEEEEEPIKFVLDDELCYPCIPYDADVDELWLWENQSMYPTRKEDSWVEDLSRPW